MINPYYQPTPIPIETRFCILFALLLLLPPEYYVSIITIFFLTHLYMIEQYLLR